MHLNEYLWSKGLKQHLAQCHVTVNSFPTVWYEDDRPRILRKNKCGYYRQPVRHADYSIALKTVQMTCDKAYSQWSFPLKVHHRKTMGQVLMELQASLATSLS